MKGFDIKKSLPLILGSFVVVLAGVATGWVINSKVINKQSSSLTPAGSVGCPKEVGTLLSNVKYGNAVGTLKEGGIGNEGTYHLERDAGPSSFVYLTSSAIDISCFVGKKVEVWGVTFAGKKAGWLMDAAKVKQVD